MVNGQRVPDNICSGAKGIISLSLTPEAELNLLIAGRDELGLLEQAIAGASPSFGSDMLRKVMQINLKQTRLPCTHCFKLLLEINKVFLGGLKPKRHIYRLLSVFDQCSTNEVAQGESPKERAQLRQHFPVMVEFSSPGKPPTNVPMEFMFSCPIGEEIMEDLRRILQS